MKRLLLSPFRSKKRTLGEPKEEGDDEGRTNIGDVGRCATWGTSSHNNNTSTASSSDMMVTRGVGDWGARPRSKSVVSFSSQVQDVSRHLNTALVPFLTSSRRTGNHDDEVVVAERERETFNDIRLE